MTLEEKKAWIQKAIDNGACIGFREYISSLTDEEIEMIDVYSLRVDWLLWMVGKLGFPCTDEQFEEWGDESPATALKYCSSRLTDEQLERWGNKCTWAALQYYSDRLTADQLERWGSRYPWLALHYCSYRLTNEQKERFEKRVNNGNNCNI